MLVGTYLLLEMVRAVLFLEYSELKGCILFQIYRNAFSALISVHTGTQSKVLYYCVLIFYIVPATWGGAKLSDVLELVGIPKLSSVTSLGGKHVEFVSVDKCKVSILVFIDWQQLLVSPH